ncbi:unnamed protein product [Periconia digitata]|uniref:Uncharacterized protein n=1 Tax=Periconia digitata TaxID=1303443 RepID=A0A9W4UB62_9PLEO|nr:unnamed protein product [Periconia digitata]
MYANLSTAALLVLGLLGTQASAFTLMTYTSTSCTGLSPEEETSVDKGCTTYTNGKFRSIINNWSSNDDNKLLLAFYSDEKCCHANMVETFSWTDGCQEVKDGIKSWRVVDPDEPEKGKKGEDYMCDE